MFPIIPFLSYVFVVTFTPGPNNIMSLINTNRYGFKNSMKFRFGIFSGFVIIMLLSSYFNLLLYSIIPRIKIYMGIIGAIYMAYLAVKLMTAKPNNRKDNNQQFNSFFAGILLQFLNIKVILYGITVVANFIIPYYKSNTALLLFSVLLASISFISITCWSLFGMVFRELLAKYEKPFNIIMGLILLYSAYSISGISHLFS